VKALDDYTLEIKLNLHGHFLQLMRHQHLVP